MNRRHAQVAAQAGYRREYCHAPEVLFNGPFEQISPVSPVARAGGDSESNLALSCRACNSYNEARTSGRDPSAEQLFRFFVHGAMFGNTILPLMPGKH